MKSPSSTSKQASHPEFAPSVSRLRILYSVPTPSDASNPYTTLLAESVAALGAGVSFFAWKTALCGQFDIFHVHWPETLVRGSSKPRRFLRTLAGFAFLMKSRISRVKVVWTIHNLQSHEEGSWVERLFLRAFTARVDQLIYINRSPENVKQPSSTILHGDYADWYSRWLPGETRKTPGRIVFFGMVRRYKGIERLIGAFEELQGAAEGKDLSLRILGAASEPNYGAEIERMARANDAVMLELKRVPDAELAAAVSGASFVALPYTYMYNSGALLMALGLGTHVLAPRTPVNETLVEEFGEEWLTLFDDRLGAQDLARAETAAAALAPGARPDMGQRQWNLIGSQHVDLYRRLVSPS